MELDLAPFLHTNADRTQNWRYNLHGVLVHSGDVHGGHYFTLIKPQPGSRWFKFDDDRVIPVTDREVLEDNYGGELIAPGVNGPRVVKGGMKRFTNAYMLV